MRKFKLSMVTVVVAAVLSAAITAQDEPPPPPPAPKPAAAEQKVSPCPKLAIKPQAGRFVRDGVPVTFTAEISGGDPNVTPMILWSVSAGMIKSGQGERRIDVDSTGASEARLMSAELWVGGYAPECSNTASASIKIAGRAALIDQFAELPVKEEAGRVINASARLVEPGDRIQIIVYSGRTSARGYAGTAQKRMATELADSDLPLDRIRVIDGGYREQPAYEIWMVPEGAESPRPTPTIDRKDIAAPPRAAPTRRP